jgi:hypothetical protein
VRAAKRDDAANSEAIHLRPSLKGIANQLYITVADFIVVIDGSHEFALRPAQQDVSLVANRMSAGVWVGENFNVRTPSGISDLEFQAFHQTRELGATALQRRDQQAELHRMVDYNTAKRVNFNIVHEPELLHI